MAHLRILFILLVLFCAGWSGNWGSTEFGLDKYGDGNFGSGGGAEGDALLLESGDYLLLESGDKLLLE